MKTMKKIASVALALVMALSLAVPAFAAEADGKITVNNAVPDQTYTVYRIFDLESFDEKVGAYVYKVNDDWAEFINRDDIKDQYVTVAEGTGLVGWVSEADAAAFAKLALAYAEESEVALAQETKTAPKAAEGKTTSQVVFEGLELGYYLIDSSLGALCALDTTDKEVVVNEKNAVAQLTKDVDKATASIGDTVTYTLVVTAQPGAQNYVIHDKMESGLTLDVGSFTVSVGTESVAAENYKVTVNSEDLKDGDTFEITFTQGYLDTIKESTEITITYTATLNESATTGADTNDNTARLAYGENSFTTATTVKTATYEFDLVKTTSNNKVLNGAQFKLYDADEGGNEIALVKDGGAYRVATEEEKTADEFKAATIEAGSVTIKGLGDGTYYLEETQAPGGYNKLTSRQAVTIDGANLKADVEEVEGADYYKVNVEADEEKGTPAYTNSGVQVINLTGAELPSTGGIGTTIFYIAGGVLAAGAGVLLITKKRMGVEEE